MERSSRPFCCLHDHSLRQISPQKLRQIIPQTTLFGVDVAAYNGDNRYELPVPAAFLVSKTGEVIRSYVEVDYMKRLAPETALQWIDEVF